jgi:hypothetical protein
MTIQVTLDFRQSLRNGTFNKVLKRLRYPLDVMPL